MSKKYNPDQFRLFIPAHEIMQMGSSDNDEFPLIHPGTGELSETFLLKRKESNKYPSFDSHGSAKHTAAEYGVDTLAESVQKEGIKEPVTILMNDYDVHSTLLNGNHRAVSAYDIDPNYPVPVKYTDDEDAIS